MRLARIVVAATLAVGLSPVSAGAAEPAGALAICWSPSDLAANPEERSPRKLNGQPDTRPVTADLAAFSPVPEGLTGSIRRVRLRGGRKLIALTFDLCEEKGAITGYDGAIVDTLRANGVKATFFAGGKWLLDHAERAQQLMSDPNFEIGNHGWSHANVRRLDAAGTARELSQAQAAYEAMRRQLSQRQCVANGHLSLAQVPKRIELLRFPYGACNAAALDTAASQGLYAIQWDVAMADPVLAQTGERIVKTVLEHVRPGSIIIGHANGRGVHTNEALAELIPKLKTQGYEFATVSELLQAGTPEIAQDCYDRKPGDLDRYDKPKPAGPAGAAAPPEESAPVPGNG